eukprot:2262189-Prymnesium_polylepis.1
MRGAQRKACRPRARPVPLGAARPARSGRMRMRAARAEAAPWSGGGLHLPGGRRKPRHRVGRVERRRAAAPT